MNSPQPNRVFVLHKQAVKVDTRPARRFGELVYVYDDTDGPRPSIWDEKFVPEAVQRMIELGYDPEHDYFLVAGNMVPVVLVTAALPVAFHGFPRALVYDAVDRRYVIRNLGECQLSLVS